MYTENVLKTYVVCGDYLKFVLGIIISSKVGVVLRKEIINKKLSHYKILYVPTKNF